MSATNATLCKIGSFFVMFIGTFSQLEEVHGSEEEEEVVLYNLNI